MRRRHRGHRPGRVRRRAGSQVIVRYQLDISRFADQAQAGHRAVQGRGRHHHHRPPPTRSRSPSSPRRPRSRTTTPSGSSSAPPARTLDNFGRSYDQEQVDGHLFGLSQLGDDSAMLRARGRGRASSTSKLDRRDDPGRHRPASSTTACNVFNLLQAAGPDLTPGEHRARRRRACPPVGGPDSAAGRVVVRRRHRRRRRRPHRGRRLHARSTGTPTPRPAGGAEAGPGRGAIRRRTSGRRFDLGEWPEERTGGLRRTVTHRRARRAGGRRSPAGLVGARRRLLGGPRPDARPRACPRASSSLGAVFGSLYALNAIGLVLVYRANRVVNFAQAEFGGVAAVLAIEFVIHWHWNFYVAVAARPRASRRSSAPVDRGHRHPPLPPGAPPDPGRGDDRARPDPRRPRPVIPLLWKGATTDTLRGPVRRQLHRLPGDLRRQPRARRWSSCRVVMIAPRRVPPLSPTTASPSGPRPRTATGPACSASPCPACRRSCGSLAGVLSALAVHPAGAARRLRVVHQRVGRRQLAAAASRSPPPSSAAWRACPAPSSPPSASACSRRRPSGTGRTRPSSTPSWSCVILVGSCSSSGTPSPARPRPASRRGRRSARCGPIPAELRDAPRGAVGRPRPAGRAARRSAVAVPAVGQPEPVGRRRARAHLRHRRRLAARAHRAGPATSRSASSRSSASAAPPPRVLLRAPRLGSCLAMLGRHRSWPRVVALVIGLPGAAHPGPVPRGDDARVRGHVGDVLPRGALLPVVHRATHRAAGALRPAVARDRHGRCTSSRSSALLVLLGVAAQPALQPHRSGRSSPCATTSWRPRPSRLNTHPAEARRPS